MGLPINEMYKQRKDFIIVALTGISGSGCTGLANIMNKPFSEWKSLVRTKADFPIGETSTKEDVFFERKYELAYDVCEKQYETFQIIKYRNVLLYYSLLSLAQNSNLESYINNVKTLIAQKFDKSHERREDCEAEKYKVDNQLSEENIKFLCFDEWYAIFTSINDLIKNKNEYRKALYETFFSTEFQAFCERFYDFLKARDYYAKNFFVHRLANSIRATGKPLEVIKHGSVHESSNLFTIVDFINQIIKGCHVADKEASRRFVIDSVRNSLEILYLRERYNSFYMIAVHNDSKEQREIADKLSKAMYNKSRTALTEEEDKAMASTLERIEWLNSLESSIKDFEEGLFYGPDISRCVSESEIHIAKHSNGELNPGERINNFYSTEEQWMKFYALIVRPGLFTPSRDERCMSVANVAKLNSGCISRKVGCTIVDSTYAVQSVGWNDPPSPQLPCQLRYIDELCLACDNKEKESNPLVRNNKIYSYYELSDEPINNGPSFKQRLKDDLNSGTTKKKLEEQGLRYPYCFRSRYNSYKGQKDQVNTRSLHAEENTMLRLSKVGGKGLKNGIMYVTASPCILCSKKAYQIGIKEIVYLDPYTDIAPNLIINCGWNTPKLRPFTGAVGATFDKLYRPFMPYKDELAIWENTYVNPESIKDKIEKLRKKKALQETVLDKLNAQIAELEKKEQASDKASI